MIPEDFLRFAAQLTGTEVKDEAQIDRESLAAILSDDARAIDCSQLNELLLLVHKDRVEQPFFDHFFESNCTVGQLHGGLQRFQKTALFLYGNFVFAFRTLSRVKNSTEFHRKIEDATKDPAKELEYFKKRPRKLLEIDRIDKHQTPFVGYLSVGDIVGDYGRCELLHGAAREVGSSATWEELLAQAQTMAKPEQFEPIAEIVGNYREVAGRGDAGFCGFSETIDRALVRKEGGSGSGPNSRNEESEYIPYMGPHGRLFCDLHEEGLGVPGSIRIYRTIDGPGRAEGFGTKIFRSDAGLY
jgi:hypothetical protein